MNHLLLTLALAALPTIIAITLHEAAHGYVAWALGDDTAKLAGRLSLNPIRHIDPVGTIILPGVLLIGQLLTLGHVGFMFGWAKPVPVSAWKFRDPRRMMAVVAVAGPLMNFFLAWIGALALYGLPYLSDNGAEVGLDFIRLFILVNIGLGLFNLIPIPPLDGGRIAVGLLPLRLAAAWARLERAGIFIVMLVVFVLPGLLSDMGLRFDPVGQTLGMLIPGAIRLVLQLAGHDVGVYVGPEGLVLHLDGFDGPLDLLLELARAQKVDLARISVLALVEQFLAVVEGARRVRLELAADWLVMAAWLTWLKSRLLLPTDPDAAEEGELAADALAQRLAELQAIRAAAAWLSARPVLGQDVFARGAPENLTDIDRSRIAADMPALIRAYLAAQNRAAGQRQYRPTPVTYWTIKDALGRLADLVGTLPDWTSLEQFLPEDLGTPIERRAALASTLVAGLELARHGTLRLHQDGAFTPILVHAGRGAPA